MTRTSDVLQLPGSALTERAELVLGAELLAKYEPLSLLGRGGMGRVLLVRHKQLKKLVAIKLLDIHNASLEDLTRFQREARVVAKIQSRHVARVMDASILDVPQPYIVMEYLEGRDLSRLVQEEGALDPAQAVDYILQALEALAEAHALGIVHRDLKPANLFLTREPSGETCVKILDFGLAKSSLGHESIDRTVTERGSILGTPSYMAPEQFVNAKDADARSDVWGIGATLFELLAGAAPFQGETLPELYGAVMHEPIPRIGAVRPEVPSALDDLVRRCLSRASSERYADVISLARALVPFGFGDAAVRVARIERIIESISSATDFDDIPLAPSELPNQSQDSELRPLALEVSKRSTSIRVPRRRSGLIVTIGILAGSTIGIWFGLMPNRPAPSPTPASPAKVMEPTRDLPGLEEVLSASNPIEPSLAAPAAAAEAEVSAEKSTPAPVRTGKRPNRRPSVPAAQPAAAVIPQSPAQLDPFERYP